MSSKMLAINMMVFLNEDSHRYLKASFLGALPGTGKKYPSRILKHCEKIKHTIILFQTISWRPPTGFASTSFPSFVVSLELQVDLREIRGRDTIAPSPLSLVTKKPVPAKASFCNSYNFRCSSPFAGMGGSPSLPFRLRMRHELQHEILIEIVRATLVAV
jgi:hypothetical protein